MKIQLLGIDCQEDFVNSITGSLYVPGADIGIQKITDFIKRKGSSIDDINMTLDSHRTQHIAHSSFWRDPNNGDHPNPFTIITKQDVENGKWCTTSPGMQRWAAEYTAQLERGGKYPLIIWPIHCRILSDGHKLQPDLFKALCDWEEEQIAIVNYVTKGSNVKTEMYSALKAEVVDPSDPSTQLNVKFIESLQECDLIGVFGFASSHCVRATLSDIIESFGDKYISKLVLLTDATAPVEGFEKAAEDFIKEMVHRGMQTSTTDKFLR